MVRQTWATSPREICCGSDTSISADLDDAVAHVFALSNLGGMTPTPVICRRSSPPGGGDEAEPELGLSVVTAFSSSLPLASPSRGATTVAVRLHAAADMILEESGVELLPSDRETSDAMLARGKACGARASPCPGGGRGSGLPTLPRPLAVAEELAAVQQSAQVHSA